MPLFVLQIKTVDKNLFLLVQEWLLVLVEDLVQQQLVQTWMYQSVEPLRPSAVRRNPLLDLL